MHLTNIVNCPRCKKPVTELPGQYKVRRETFSCCQTCAGNLEKRRAEMKVWRAKNKEKHRRWSKRWAENNKEKISAYQRIPERRAKWNAWHNEYRRNRKAQRAEEARKYRLKDTERYRARRRRHYENNKDRLLAYRSEYIKANPWINRAASSCNRALRLKRTPKWADIKAIKDVYRSCPEGLVVDHIVPLRGKNVSGLHVHYNLQYLTPHENGKKSNKLLEQSC